MSDEITLKVQEIIISALRAEKMANSIGVETRLDALGLDSLNVVDVLLGLEEEFGIAVDDEEIEPETVETIASLVDFVQARHKTG